MIVTFPSNTYLTFTSYIFACIIVSSFVLLIVFCPPGASNWAKIS